MTKKKAPEEKKKTGRPSAYKPEYCQAIIEFFSIDPYTTRKITITTKKGDTIEKKEEVANDIVFLDDFADKIGVSYETVRAWAADIPEFSVAYKKAKRLQEKFIMVNMLRGNYVAPGAIFTLKNVAKWRDEDDTNWTDRTEHEVAIKPLLVM